MTPHDISDMDIFDIGDRVFSFLRSHWKAIIISLAFIAALFLLSYWMTLRSITYSPLKILTPSDTQARDLDIPYSKSASYSESITISSLALDTLSDMNKTISTISDAVDAASALNDASGGGGTFLIPAGASKIGSSDMWIYGWSKTYSVLFNQIDCADVMVVFALGNSMISGKLSAGTGVLSEITIYQIT